MYLALISMSYESGTIIKILLRQGQSYWIIRNFKGEFEYKENSFFISSCLLMIDINDNFSVGGNL